jgi:hypothetical protein
LIEQADEAVWQGFDCHHGVHRAVPIRRPAGRGAGARDPASAGDWIRAIEFRDGQAYVLDYEDYH